MDEAAEFGRLLRGLKERSGLSYGVLAKRLHLSTSSLHRYCSGEVVPTDYGPVERLARLCRASPEELVELHRCWVLADAVRDRKAGKGNAVREAGRGSAVGAVAPDAPEAVASETPEVPEPGVTAPEPSASAPVAPSVAETPATSEVPEPHASRAPRTRRGRLRPAVLLPLGALVAVGAVLLAWQPSLGLGLGGGDARPSAAASTAGAGKETDGIPGTRPGERSPGATSGAAAGAAVPLTYNARPYAWEDPCSQHYLIDRSPEHVSPPPTEQDAPGWVSAFGAVSSGEQYVALTLQGKGAETVVLEHLNVRVVSSGAPLAWNDYSMGVGCGGGVPSTAFDVDLDAGHPAAKPAGGQRDLPLKVSESDPEVFSVLARTTAHDVRWYLELEWSSGSRHGVVQLDDHGRPFHASGGAGRPGYDFPLGANGWISRTSPQ
ncbi:helix-turn-helix domain-containing protein [Streptomyces sp. NPDC048664]|uniref:helix-turn-helix domain-containing protein n=1 Tax=Streptomyces sp. NPDC048664 TaxID=3154505 RepID=UPI00344AB289